MKLPHTLFVLLLIAGCGAHPDQESAEQLMLQIHENHRMPRPQTYTEGDNFENFVRNMGPQFQVWHQVVDGFLEEHPEMTPSTREKAEAVRDSAGELAEMYTRLIEEDRFELTPEEAARENELRLQFGDNLLVIAEIMDQRS